MHCYTAEMVSSQTGPLTNALAVDIQTKCSTACNESHVIKCWTRKLLYLQYLLISQILRIKTYLPKHNFFF